MFVTNLVSFDNVAIIKKTELTKKVETQTPSPSKKSIMKPSVRQTRPVQHHSCPRRRPTGDKLLWFVAQLVFPLGVTGAPVPITSILQCPVLFDFGVHFFFIGFNLFIFLMFFFLFLRWESLVFCCFC